MTPELEQELGRCLFRATNDAFLIVHPRDLQLLDANPTAERLTGLRRKQLQELSLDNLFVSTVPAALAGLLRACQATDSYQSVDDFAIRTATGEQRPVQVSVSRIPVEPGPFALVVMRDVIDITERKKLEEQLNLSRRMEAVGRLAGGVAHDFNNLLTAILGYASLMLGQLEPDHAWRSYLEEIQRAGTRAADLTRQLLAFGRRQLLMPRVLDLNQVVASAVELFTRVLSEDVVLETALAPNLGRVKADAGQLEMVLVNLADNAREAMPHGGKLILSTSDADDVSDHPEMPPGAYVQLTIADTGRGMDAKTLARVFEPFFTTKELGKGAGLGLATVYGIIKQSGGFIYAASRTGQGTTFTIYLPRVEAQASDPTSPPAVPDSRAGTETVLLVEDEDGVRALAERALEQSGYRVLAARGGPEALVACAQHAGPIDLVLTDVVMPDMDGPTLVQRLMVCRPHVKVLFMSGYADSYLFRHGVGTGKTALLEKPFGVTDLLNKVRDVLDGKPALSTT